MHFSIPETQEFSDGSNVFTGFKIYINGNFHCTLRYKQLHSLHEQLKKSLLNLSLPQFPPKKLLTLTKSETNQRRIALERYLQLVGQDPQISRSNLLRSFLLQAQQESASIEVYDTSIDVYLLNGFKIPVNITTTECTSRVLEKTLHSIELSDDLIFYFGLFIIRNESNGKVTMLRKLMDFESPFFSLQNAEDCQIVIRKNYWDANYDLTLMRNKVALDLLVIQSNADIDEGSTIVDAITKTNLKELYASGKKAEFMNLVRSVPFYGCIHFHNVLSDFPEVNSIATIITGNQELTIRFINEPIVQETKFRVTRMRCWRVTTIANITNDTKIFNVNCKNPYSYELSFEYLMSKNCLKWVKLVTEQAMLISVCLQSMVDELLNQKNGSDINNINLNMILDKQLEYIRRDESFNNRTSDATSESSLTNMNEIKQKSETKTFFPLSKHSNEKESVQNGAFEDIGDDDL